jgi:hypothetical protein
MPGDVLSVDLIALQTRMQDADPAIGELAGRSGVGLSAGRDDLRGRAVRVDFRGDQEATNGHWALEQPSGSVDNSW